MDPDLRTDNVTPASRRIQAVAAWLGVAGIACFLVALYGTVWLTPYTLHAAVASVAFLLLAGVVAWRPPADDAARPGCVLALWGIVAWMAFIGLASLAHPPQPRRLYYRCLGAIRQFVRPPEPPPSPPPSRP